MIFAPVQLVLDIGNTAIKAAWFMGTELLDVRVINEQNSVTPEYFDTPGKPDRVMLASVREADPSFLFDFQVPVFRLNDQTPLPFMNTYRSPGTLGADRIANAA